MRLLNSLVVRRWWVLLAALGAGALTAGPKPTLGWSVTEAKFGGPADAPYAEVVFTVTNTSPTEIVVKYVQPSCGCTQVKTPPLPWRLPPGATGVLETRIDIRGKSGELHKKLMVYTTDNTIQLPLVLQLPEADLSDERVRNQMLALSDARAIFKGDCVKCHVEPAVGKRGAELFHAACAICHEAEHRAKAVPDLALAAADRTREQWTTWITHGREGTLMPAFAVEHGGILDAEQVRSLVDYLATRDWTEDGVEAERKKFAGGAGR